MSRISDTFADLRKKNQRALIPYVMAGYPDYTGTLNMVRGLIRGGADIIELGFPFSDPLADGPVIQNAATVSLYNNDTTLTSYFDMVDEIRAMTDIPLIIMTYCNIAYNIGYAKFASELHRHAVNGVILPDMPVDESKEYKDAASNYDIDTIFLASPNSTDERCNRIIEATSGFLYMVAVYGTTGVSSGVHRYAIDALRRVKGMADDLPVGMGFGVNTGDDVKQYVRGGADAIIVGSAILNIVKESPSNVQEAISKYVSSLKRHTTYSA